MNEERIGKYEVLGKIAEGGFGTVYKARDPFIKRVVAIKTCPIDDDEVRHRFFREARIVGGFDHPNVTIVHDFGLEGDRAFLVQEYLPGEDLAEVIRRRAPLPLRTKVSYLLQAARGLAYAHSKGVIHRDIKPANLRVLQTDQLKVLDFGIAKLATSGTRLTRKGVAVGTIGYLSPEQLREIPLDARTDIFSYGVTAYELVTHRKPFRGPDISSVMRSILETEPEPIFEVAPGTPDSLVQVIRRCLEKDRDRRYSSFEAVITDLEGILAALPAEDAPATTAPIPAVDGDPDDSSEADTGEHTTLALPAAGEPDVEAPTPDSPPRPAGARPVAVEPEPAEDSPVRGSPSGTSTESRTLPAIVGIVILVVLVVAGGLLIGWYFYYAKDPETAPPTRQLSAIVPGGEETPPAAPSERGVLLVDAAPWGEVVSVLNDGGEEVPEAAGHSTPLRLDVQPGVYSVVIGHPDLDEPRVCQAEVVPGGLARCDVTIREVDTSDYFRTMGWWQ